MDPIAVFLAVAAILGGLNFFMWRWRRSLTPEERAKIDRQVEEDRMTY
jgi:hypothetical protein